MLTRHADVPEDRTTGGVRAGLLRLALKLDAVASGALGLLTAVAAPALETMLGIPATLSVPLGLFLVGFAAAVWLTGTRARVSRPVAWAIVGLNVLWTFSSIAVVAADWPSLTMLGVAIVLAQAAAVALFAGLQLIGLRRAGAGTAEGGTP